MADKYRIPTLILLDGALGQMMEAVTISDKTVYHVEKPWAITGRKMRHKANVIDTLCFDKNAAEQCNLARQKKYDIIKQNEMRCEELFTDDAELILVAYGITARVAKSAMIKARAQGLNVGFLRPITLWPFPSDVFLRAAQTAKALLVSEMSAGQMVEDVELAVRCQRPVYFYGRMGGNIPSADELCQQILKVLNGKGGN